MSHPPAAVARAAGLAPTREAVVDDEDDVQALVDALHDPDCRRILEATGEAALSAKELSSTCDLPLSSVYRKLERLTEARLVEESVRFDGRGKHANEYGRLVEDVQISVDEAAGLAVRVSYRKPVGGASWLPAA